MIEAKSKKEDNPLYKSDHAQLLEAENWFKGAYPGHEAVRVQVKARSGAAARAVSIAEGVTQPPAS